MELSRGHSASTVNTINCENVNLIPAVVLICKSDDGTCAVKFQLVNYFSMNPLHPLDKTLILIVC